MPIWNTDEKPVIKTEFIATESLDFLMTENNDYLITNQSNNWKNDSK